MKRWTIAFLWLVAAIVAGYCFAADGQDRLLDADLPYFVWGLANLTLDATGEEAAWIFQAPADGEVEWIHWRTGTVTVSDDVHVSIQGVDATNGDPDGTIKEATACYGTEATVASNTFYRTQMGVTCTMTEGEWIAVVFTIGTYTAGDFDLRNSQANYSFASYIATDASGSWVKSSAGAPSGALEYDDNTVPHNTGMLPAARSTILYNSTDNPDEYGNVFVPKVPMLCTGATFVLDLDGDAEVTLYDSTSTAIAGGSVYLDKDIRITTSRQIFRVNFSDEAYLVPGDTYYIAIAAQDATDIGGYNFTVNGSYPRMLDVYAGQHVYQCKREHSPPGAWTLQTNVQPFVYPIVEAVGVHPRRHPGMTGGM